VSGHPSAGTHPCHHARVTVFTDAAPRPKVRVHRPTYAVPAIFSAAHPDPLRALVDTFHHAAGTFDDRRAELISEFGRRWLE